MRTSNEHARQLCQQQLLVTSARFTCNCAGARRVINLKHNGAAVPQQLAGRINPGVWQAFMTDVEQVMRQLLWSVGVYVQYMHISCVCHALAIPVTPPWV